MPEMTPSEDKRPHFFLSYARSRFRPENTDPDRWVTKFYNDLCMDVSQATGASVPGFMDREIPVGTAWPDRLQDALSKCRVFVALFSPAYFTSEYCGKEWAAFAQRIEKVNTDSKLPSAIIPAMWMPMGLEELPDSLHSLQNISPGFPQAYATEGLYGIMKLGRYREQYKETVLRLANTIKERATECALTVSAVSPLDSLDDPFSNRRETLGREAVRLTLAAQTIDQLPSGRDTYYYGRTAQEWNPYRSQDHTMPIGAFAQQILTDIGHQSVVTGINDPVDEPSDAQPTEAAEALRVLIVDPWSTRDRNLGDQLRKLTQSPTNVLAPFNGDDPETTAAAGELATDLETALGDNLTLPGSASRVPTLDAFRTALPKAVSTAVDRYFKTASTHPPKTDPEISRRPRLHGPQA